MITQTDLWQTTEKILERFHLCVQHLCKNLASTSDPLMWSYILASTYQSPFHPHSLLFTGGLFYLTGVKKSKVTISVHAYILIDISTSADNKSSIQHFWQTALHDYAITTATGWSRNISYRVWWELFLLLSVSAGKPVHPLLEWIWERCRWKCHGFLPYRQYTVTGRPV